MSKDIRCPYCGEKCRNRWAKLLHKCTVAAGYRAQAADPWHDRVLAAMSWCAGMQAAGHTRVPIVAVMGQLDPEHKMHGAPDPRADPVTGCLPVTAEPPP